MTSKRGDMRTSAGLDAGSCSSPSCATDENEFNREMAVAASIKASFLFTVLFPELG